MNILDMIGYLDALQKRLFQRFDLQNSDYGAFVGNKLQLEALQSFGDELNSLSDADRILWLLNKISLLEARIYVLSSAFQELEAKIGGGVSNLESADNLIHALPTSLADNASVTIDEDIVQEGFYETEHAKDGTVFRWLGPNPIARVYIQRIRKPLELKLYIKNVFKGVELEKVRVALNGGSWAVADLKKVGKSYLLSFHPEAGPGESGLSDYVDIDCGATYSPADDGSADTRKLGVALSKIEIASL